MLAVTILGNNSALPANGRNPTAQVLQTQSEAYLVDCGEGTQQQMVKYKIRTSKLAHIFISHLHGDHYFGLIGLLTSMGLLGRTSAIHLYAAPALQKIILLQLNAADTELPYPLYFHPILEEGIICNDGKITVQSFAVNHRIACWGFLFKEIKNPRKIDPERVKSFEVPAAYYKKLQKGHDYKTKKGDIILNDQLTIAATAAKSYAFCADTKFNPAIAEKVKSVDLLYHEATYLKDLEQRAEARYHSTAEQAATIAKLANAKKLLIGHFSSKYETLTGFLEEAKEVFENTEIAREGVCFKI